MVPVHAFLLILGLVSSNYIPDIPVKTFSGDTVRLARPEVPLLILGISATGDERSEYAARRAFDDTMARMAVVAGVTRDLHDRGVEGAAVMMAVNPFEGALPGMLSGGEKSAGATVIIDSAGAVRFVDQVADYDAAITAAQAILDGRRPVILGVDAPLAVRPGDEVLVTITIANLSDSVLDAVASLRLGNGGITWQPISSADSGSTTALLARRPGELSRIALRGHALSEGKSEQIVTVRLGDQVESRRFSILVTPNRRFSHLVIPAIAGILIAFMIIRRKRKA